jgi:hypothetical protein
MGEVRAVSGAGPGSPGANAGQRRLPAGRDAAHQSNDKEAMNSIIFDHVFTGDDPQSCGFGIGGLELCSQPVEDHQYQ